MIPMTRTTKLSMIGMSILSVNCLLRTRGLNETMLAASRTSSNGENLPNERRDDRTTTHSGRVENNSHTGGFTYPPVLYGHVHMAKSAGTEINGELATHFERICGHKGYSYDALEFNHRMEEYLVQNLAKKKQTAGVADSTKAMENDLIAAKHPGFNRGRVPGSVMREIGYHDCDWISFEDKWMTWESVASFAATIPLKLEMHVPCRDPLPHLMSQCNHWGKHFDCNATDMVAEVEKCLFKMDRYNDQLKKMTNVHLKCFNPIPIDSYVGYMSGILQPRRISTKYVHRETNRPRDKDKECIWSNPEIAEKVNAILLKTPYYRFCDQCMGSHDDLLAQ